MFLEMLKDVLGKSIPIGIVVAFVISVVRTKAGKEDDKKDGDPFLALTLKCIAVLTILLLLFH